MTYIGGAIIVVTTEFASSITSASRAKPSSTKIRLKSDSRIEIRTPNNTQATPVSAHNTTFRCQRPADSQDNARYILTSSSVCWILDAGWSIAGVSDMSCPFQLERMGCECAHPHPSRRTSVKREIIAKKKAG